MIYIALIASSVLTNVLIVSRQHRLFASLWEGKLLLSLTVKSAPQYSLISQVSSGVLMLPLEEAGEMMNSAALADFMSVARAANIPDDLLWNILDQAKTLYNHESSPFIQS